MRRRWTMTATDVPRRWKTHYPCATLDFNNPPQKGPPYLKRIVGAGLKQLVEDADHVVVERRRVRCARVRPRLEVSLGFRKRVVGIRPDRRRRLKHRLRPWMGERVGGRGWAWRSVRIKRLAMAQQITRAMHKQRE